MIEAGLCTVLDAATVQRWRLPAAVVVVVAGRPVTNIYLRCVVNECMLMPVAAMFLVVENTPFPWFAASMMHPCARVFFFCVGTAMLLWSWFKTLQLVVQQEEEEEKEEESRCRCL